MFQVQSRVAPASTRGNTTEFRAFLAGLKTNALVDLVSQVQRHLNQVVEFLSLQRGVRHPREIALACTAPHERLAQPCSPNTLQQ